MGLFGSKNKSLEDQFKILSQDFLDAAKKIQELELEIEKFRTQLISLRGLVNRKLSKEAGEIETEKIKSVDGLDSLRE